MTPDRRLEKIPIELFVIGPTLREILDDPSIEPLAANFAEYGMDDPVHAYLGDGKYHVFLGARRLLAARKRGEKEMLAWVQDEAPPRAEIVHRQLVSNTQRKPLTAEAVAGGMEELVQLTGGTARDVARKLGYSDAMVSKLREVLRQPARMQESVRNGRLSASAAYELRGATDAEKQAIVDSIPPGGRLTRDEVKRQLKAKRGKRHAPAPLPRIVADLGERRTITVKGPGLSDLETLLAWLDEARSALKRAHEEGFGLSELSRLFKDKVGNATA